MLNCKIVTARQLSSVLGKLNSIVRSHGNIVRMYSRSAQNLLAIHTTLYGWDAKFMLDKNTRNELTFFSEHLHRFNGTYISDYTDPIITKR